MQIFNQAHEENNHKAGHELEQSILVLDTRWLFCRLLRFFRIATVCDVGSMDASDALRFRHYLPSARIIALEPNPMNFELMAKNSTLGRKAIIILPYAASDKHGRTDFFMAEADYASGKDRYRRGTGSLYRRTQERASQRMIEVQTVRVDELLLSQSSFEEPLALWIDVEGSAFEVIRGCSKVLGRTQLIHVEVESATIIDKGQKLFADVERELINAGFALIGTDQSRHALQFNALFVRKDILHARGMKILQYARYAGVRRKAYRRVVGWLPNRIRNIFDLHLTETRCK